MGDIREIGNGCQRILHADQAGWAMPLVSDFMSFSKSSTR
jgi:hypothetical protein